jgi:AhpD family alkylhydroperoxidase
MREASVVALIPSSFAAPPGPYLSFSTALGGGALGAKLREQIALAVAEANGCEYCLAAHSTIGKMVGLSNADVVASRQGRSSDPKAAAALAFARAVLDRRGDVSDADLRAVREAGHGDGEIAEILAHVALNVFTNYFNRFARTNIDF